MKSYLKRAPFNNLQSMLKVKLIDVTRLVATEWLVDVSSLRSAALQLYEILLGTVQVFPFNDAWLA